MARYVGEFKLAKSENLLYYFEDGPYKDVLAFLHELTSSQPKYMRSSRAWTVPLPKISKKDLQSKLEEKGWTCDIL